jgi:hypothetical protein
LSAIEGRQRVKGAGWVKVFGSSPRAIATKTPSQLRLIHEPLKRAL